MGGTSSESCFGIGGVQPSNSATIILVSYLVDVSKAAFL
jgi:hypothetical protein